MIKIFLTIFLLAGISTKTVEEINFNEETKFDKETCEFSFEYDKYGPLIAYVNQDNKKSNIYLTCSNEGGDIVSNKTILKPGGGAILSLKRGVCNLNLTEEETTGQLKGNIWIYPLLKELKIDFTKNFEKKYTIYTNRAEEPLVLTNEKLEKDIKIKFQYSKSYKDENIVEQKLKNPFTVCEGDDNCKDNLETYTFKKNTDYKIKVKFEAKNVTGFEDELYFLPAFSMKSSGKFVSFSLMSIIVFLLF